MADAAAEEALERALAACSESFIAAAGPGGQNVNKVAPAVQLRVDVYALRLAPPVFARFKELADLKSEIFDEDILALVSDEGVTHEHEQYRFVSLSQRSETGEHPYASIVFTVNGEEVKSSSDGNGPVDASLKAIEAHVKSGAEMVLYSVNAISGSTESQGEVTVRLQNSGRVVNGVGADPDIIVASAKAYLSALNKLQSKADRVAAQG